MNEYILSDTQFEKYTDRVDFNYKSMKRQKDFLASYLDPDARIIQEYEVDGEIIRFSPDGICGIKYLLSYYEGCDYAEAYQIIRKKIILWPKHRQSINQKRFCFFRDRIDFTIFDILQFYKNGESKLVREGSKSAKFLKKLGSFEDFVKEYGFEEFLEGENVKNLANSEIIRGYEDYVFSNEVNKKYLKELIVLLENSKSCRMME